MANEKAKKLLGDDRFERKNSKSNTATIVEVVLENQSSGKNEEEEEEEATPQTRLAKNVY
jgi:hypothetical protein